MRRYCVLHAHMHKPCSTRTKQGKGTRHTHAWRIPLPPSPFPPSLPSLPQAIEEFEWKRYYPSRYLTC